MDISGNNNIITGLNVRADNQSSLRAFVTSNNQSNLAADMAANLLSQLNQSNEGLFLGFGANSANISKGLRLGFFFLKKKLDVIQRAFQQNMISNISTCKNTFRGQINVNIDGNFNEIINTTLAQANVQGLECVFNNTNLSSTASKIAATINDQISQTNEG